MRHIVQFSGGKDYTAMLDLMIKKDMQIDEVVFFDTGWEFDSVYANIHKHEQMLKRIGIPFTKLEPKHWKVIAEEGLSMSVLHMTNRNASLSHVKGPRCFCLTDGK